MNRRIVLRWCSVGSLAFLAGCGDYRGNPSPPRRLRVIVREVRPTDEGHELTAELSSAIPQETIEDVTLVAFSENGNQICRKPIGTLDGERMEATVTTACSGFPTIVTAETSHSVCGEVVITIVHWIGTDEQKQKHIPNELSGEGAVYDETEVRQCDESLPPERLVNDSDTSGMDQSAN